ncbi:fibrobacter succinogenes major paralogous domain-containing protein [uncultured Fibrobacter sp.]|uniref:fibrobacter succinogenes major paralogous domain-containing protein n=1 Tax=uncultured Fibrobacter sp. TaxID=261512 RepID=UPI0025E2947A|nr:fibrobacter succinogenes major paralogous domain-containing protein [uncultured Fibrobacter sp.]
MLLECFLCGKMSLRGGVAAAAVSGLLLLAACGGDSGTSASSDNGTSSSEKIQSSSSSSKVESSSSVILNGDSHKESSSSSSTSLKSVSSSSRRLSSSSSLTSTSSSSKLSSSSSSSPMVKSSSSSKDDMRYSSSKQSSSSSKDDEIDDGWSWDVPKEAYLNPEIDYGSMTDSRDGQIYKTVKIGNQVWMAENLNYADSVKTPSLMGKNWCYANKAENCAVAGRLYTWAAAIDSVKFATDADNPQDCGYGKTCSLPAKVQGVCPDGWHLPSQVEWETLFTEVGGSSTAGKILMSQTGWYNNGNGTDGVGFSALPVGCNIRYDREFLGDGGYAAFWSASDYSSSLAYFMGMSSANEYAYLNPFPKDYGLSVRCLKDL